MRKILTTSALPYANGAIHLGHLVEYIQTDIWVRFQNLRGNECHYVCADDAHGSPIMIRAEKEGITPQELIDKTKAEHLRDFQGFLIDHHQFHSTHSKENQEITADIYKKLRDSGKIIKKTISQAYDAEKNMFLPDRFVKGECPKCHAKDQYGDNCENCGTTYAPLDLINPYSVLSNTKPIEKESEHYFFDLPQFEGFLQDWLKNAQIQPTMRNKLAEWFVSGLMAWDISRDAPYWGFEIPDAKDKFFYVWLDAPIGYLASFKALCEKKGIDYEGFLRDEKTEIYHFIGKDIAYFHMLFWPAVLEGSGYPKPKGVFCHGFLTVNGEKMSKSRGTFIKAETYLKHLKPEYLRYYFASKLSSKVEDIDLNLEDFKQKANADLVGKLVNIASRCAPFLKKFSNNKTAAKLGENVELFNNFAAKSEIIADYYEKREYSAAIKEIMSLADIANEFVDREKPWVLAKNPENAQKVIEIATVGLNLYYQLIIYLSPVLPELAQKSAEFLNLSSLTWDNVKTPLLDKEIKEFKPLMARIEDKQIQAIIADSKEDLKAENQIKQDKIPEISIDDFAKLDIRVAKVLECEKVEGSDKLLKFRLSVGDLGERTVFSGIQKYHNPEELKGQLVIYLANLKARKMRFGTSEGMILSASNNETLQVLLAYGRAVEGMKIS